MRTLLGCLLYVTILAPAAAADEKIDAKKLVGKWEPQGANAEKATFEFAADGKLKIDSAGDTLTGTWKLDGNKLALTFALGENVSKDTVTITKLTDAELSMEDAKKEKKRSFKRVK